MAGRNVSCVTRSKVAYIIMQLGNKYIRSVTLITPGIFSVQRKFFRTRVRSIFGTVKAAGK